MGTSDSTNVSRRRFLKYAGAGAVALAAAGIGGYEVYENYLAPKPPLTLAWWGGPELTAMTPAFNAFQQQTGSTVQTVLHQGGSANTIPKIAAAWPNVIIDIIGISVAGTLMLAQQGFAIPLSSSDISALSLYPNNDFVNYNGNPYSVIFASDSAIVVYRNDKISTPITSLHDLLRPELKGHVGIGEPSIASGAYLLSWCLDYGGNEKNVDPGFDALKQLGEMGNLALIWQEEADALNALASGDIWAMQFSDYGTGSLVAPNPSQFPYMSVVKNPAAGKTLFNGDCLAIIDGPRKQLAETFANIFLSSSIQAQFAPVNGEPPTNPQVQLDPKLAPWVNSGAELAQYGYFPDPSVVVSNMSSWKSRFDQEIRPLLSSG